MHAVGGPRADLPGLFGSHPPCSGGQIPKDVVGTTAAWAGLAPLQGVHPKSPSSSVSGNTSWQARRGWDRSLGRKGGSRPKIDSGRAGQPLEDCDLHGRPEGRSQTPGREGLGSDALVDLEAPYPVERPGQAWCGAGASGQDPKTNRGGRLGR